MLGLWQNLSLRLRLTLLYIGLLMVLLIGLGFFLYFDTRDFLISSTMLRVQAQAQPGVERSYRANGPRSAPLVTPPGGVDPSGGPGGNPPSLNDIASFLAHSQTSANTKAAACPQRRSRTSLSDSFGWTKRGPGVLRLSLRRW